MKQFYFLLFCLISSLGFGQDLVITGVFDGPLTGGTPKAIEIYVINNIADLSTYGIGSANNGGGSDGIELVLEGSASAGDYIYIATEQPQFNVFFGFDPDYISSSASINGDDAIELFNNVVDTGGGVFTGDVLDTFGDINVDGTGQPWEYLDGWAYRTSNTGPDGTSFVLANWSFSGINALDGETSNATATSPFPTNTFVSTTATIKENEIEGFTMFPNPVSEGLLRINTQVNSEKTIQIFDILGKQVLLRTTKSEHISVSALNAGIYILKVTEQGKTATRKLVIK